MRLPVFGDDPMIPFDTDKKMQINLPGPVVSDGIWSLGTNK